jgi:hypothetical protein
MSPAAAVGNVVPAPNVTDSLSLTGSSVAGDEKLTQTSPAVPAQAPVTLTVTGVQVAAPAVGIATALKASIRPKATKILIIFLTSFLLSNYQAFPDFEAVSFCFCSCPDEIALGCPVR